MSGSLEGDMLPTEIHRFPIDESVYGVRGMAGNMCDWMLDQYRLNWDTDSDENLKAYRGGSWRNDARSCRIAYRYSNYPQNRSTRIGIRLCRSLDVNTPPDYDFDETEGAQTYRVAW
ncbi:MAG: SUMF1/EgtB/PvdO family nonheme iron enzyme [Myxococcota bacterium]|nr:SUMF1/EgtB/PvdO family nonheme iron enzyme [Myxococcota bacterium]